MSRNETWHTLMLLSCVCRFFAKTSMNVTDPSDACQVNLHTTLPIRYPSCTPHDVHDFSGTAIHQDQGCRCASLTIRYNTLHLAHTVVAGAGEHFWLPTMLPDTRVYLKRSELRQGVSSTCVVGLRHALKPTAMLHKKNKTTHLGKSLSEGSNAVQNLVENHPKGPHIHLRANSRVVTEALRG